MDRERSGGGIAVEDDIDEAKREAYKMNKLVSEGIVSSKQASEMSADTFDETIEQEFDRRFWQRYHQPNRIEPKSEGQRAEDVIIDVLNESQIGFRVEHAPAALDQGSQQVDLQLWVDGSEHPINVQLTFRLGVEAEQKRAKLNERTIFIQLPDQLHVAMRKNDSRTLHAIAQGVLRQILAEMAARPYYKLELGLLKKRYLGQQAA